MNLRYAYWRRYSKQHQLCVNPKMKFFNEIRNKVLTEFYEWQTNIPNFHRMKLLLKRLMLCSLTRCQPHSIVATFKAILQNTMKHKQHLIAIESTFFPRLPSICYNAKRFNSFTIHVTTTNCCFSLALRVFVATKWLLIRNDLKLNVCLFRLLK